MFIRSLPSGTDPQHRVYGRRTAYTPVVAFLPCTRRPYGRPAIGTSGCRSLRANARPPAEAPLRTSHRQPRRSGPPSRDRFAIHPASRDVAPGTRRRPAHAVAPRSYGPPTTLSRPPHALHPGRCVPSVPSTPVWQEHETSDRDIRLPKPSCDRAARHRKRRSICRGERIDPTPRSRRISDHQQPRDASAIPSPGTCDLGRQPSLAIDPGKRRLRVGYDRLDLRHEDDARCRVEPKHVDRPALTPDGERHLDVGDPPRGTESDDQLVDESGMRLVEQPVQAFAVPPKANVERRIKGLSDAA